MRGRRQSKLPEVDAQLSVPAAPVASVSVVVPVLDDRRSLGRLLDDLSAHAPTTWEVVVVDGGSSDGSRAEAERRGVRVIAAQASRGWQLDLGYAASSGALLWFVHADATIDALTVREVQRVYEAQISQGLPAWGRFDVRLVGSTPSIRQRLVGGLMNWRSRWTAMCTGDQGIFASRDLLEAVGGIPRQALMEDIELSKRLKAKQPPLSLRARIGTSARRWESNGFLRTVLLMWWLRLRYFFGADPDQLVRRYYS